MRKRSFWKMVIVLVGVVALFFVWQGCGKGKVKSVVKNSYDEVTSQLDKGGNFYLYASTEKFIQSVDEFAVSLRKVIALQSPQSKSGENQGLEAFDFIYNLFKKSGLTEISGVGVSSVPIAEDLNHIKVVVHHYKDNKKGLIWQMTANQPELQEELAMLPMNTVFSGFGNFDVKQFWTFFTTELSQSNFPEFKEGVAKMGPSLLKEGIDLNKILDSLTGRMGYIVTLDTSVRKTLPFGSMPMEIPDPGLALVFSVNDDYLFNLLASKIPAAKKTERDHIKTIRIEVPPMPITFEPVIVLAEGRLIFATNTKIVDSLFVTKKKGNGLITGEEFKRMSAYMPEKGNGFRFVSARFMETFSDIMQKSMANKGSGDKDDAEVMGLMYKFFPKKVAMYMVTQRTDEGFISESNHSMGVESLLMLPAVITTGIVAAIAIPNIITATSKGKQKATMGDMKFIGNSIESYIVDEYKAPVGNSLEEITPLLVPFHAKILPLKDAWGNDFLYIHGTGEDKETYFIASPGKDGIFNGWEQRGEYMNSGPLSMDNDIIYANGAFIFAPMVR